MEEENQRRDEREDRVRRRKKKKRETKMKKEEKNEGRGQQGQDRSTCQTNEGIFGKPEKSKSKEFHQLTLTSPTPIRPKLLEPNPIWAPEISKVQFNLGPRHIQMSSPIK
jgi:hypothetical protein